MYTCEDIDNFIEKLKKNEDFLLLDNKAIALNFISDVLGVDTNKNLDEIQQEFYELLGKDIDAEHIYEKVEMTIKKNNGESKECLVNSPKEKIVKKFELKTEQEFYNYVLENVLYIKGSIIETFNNYFTQATKDLKEIDSIIQDCNKDLKNKNIDKYSKDKLTYFIELNTTAKEEIINFLCNDIKDIIIRDMYTKKFNIWGLLYNTPYQCYKAGNRYSNKRNFSLEVKFFDLRAGDREPYQLYNSDREKYYNYVEKYIVENEIVEELRYSTSNNYLLKHRKEFLSQIINTYTRADYMAFIALSAIQIEGLFSDYLQVVDNDYKKGNITLVPKLQKIKEKIDFFYGYEYFTFEFPKLRNKMAHGENLNDSNIKHIAYEVLLDLRYVINLFDDRELEPNKVFNILESERDINELTLQCIMLLDSNVDIEKYIFNKSRDCVIYEKYGKEINEIRKHILQDEFWDFFKEKIEKGEWSLNYGIKMGFNKLLIKLRHIIKDNYSQSEYEAVDTHCTKININIGKIKKGRKEKRKKIKDLLNSNVNNDIQ